jgi:hypothetical protein
LQKAPSTSLSFKAIEKTARFRREVLLYSGLIIEKCVCLARFSYIESHPGQQIPLTSAEFLSGIKCDRRKRVSIRIALFADDSD